MIIIEFIRRRGRGEAGLVARVRADCREISVDGPEPKLIDPSQPVLSLRDGRTITKDDDPEEWVRGLAVSFRTAYLSAAVVEDTNSPPDVEIAAANVHEPLSADAADGVDAGR